MEKKIQEKKLALKRKKQEISTELINSLEELKLDCDKNISDLKNGYSCTLTGGGFSYSPINDLTSRTTRAVKLYHEVMAKIELIDELITEEHTK